MGTIRFERKYLRAISIVAALTLLAALGGIWSEVQGQANVNNFKFRGQNIQAQWNNFAGPGTSSWAQVWAQEGVSGPGKPQASNVMNASGNISSWAPPFQDNFWASGNISANDMHVPNGLPSGTLSASVPGIRQTWTPAGGWTTTPITAQVNLSLTNNGAIQQEMSRNHFHSHVGTPYQTRWDFNARTAWDTSGSGDITLSGSPFVPANTATAWGVLRSVHAGSFSVVTP